MRRNKSGISLIVLVITLTSTYDEMVKIDRFPPENIIEKSNKIIDAKKVVGCRLTTFNKFSYVVLCKNAIDKYKIQLKYIKRY